MSQFINNLKRSIAMITAMCLVLLQGTSHITFASMSVEDNEHFAIVTKKLEKYGREFNIYGKINETVSIPDMHGGIVSMLGKETQVFDDSHTISMTDYVGENNIYSKALSINCDTSKFGMRWKCDTRL